MLQKIIVFIVVGFQPLLQFGARDQDRTFSPAKRWKTDRGGYWRPKRREVRREEKSEERRFESEMSGDFSDGEDSGGPDADFVDPTADASAPRGRHEAGPTSGENSCLLGRR